VANALRTDQAPAGPEEDHAYQFATYERVRDDCIARIDKIEVSVRDHFLREKIFETAPALKIMGEA
jgi:hypothetical protein